MPTLTETDDETFCLVCGEYHDSRLVQSHERAAGAYEREYGVSI